MPIPAKISKFLGAKKVRYDVVPHKTVFTVYDLAQTLKLKLEQIAKTLLVKADKRYILVVMPAHYRLDFGKLKKALKVKDVRIAQEKDMQAKFKTKPGAMVPFGPIHKLDVITDKSFLKVKDALFSAGSFTDSVRMKIKDYLQAVEPAVADIGKKFPIKLQIVKKAPKKPHHKGKGKPKAAKRKKR